jgi:hypothetical protein
MNTRPAGVCWMLSCVTTLGLIFLPRLFSLPAGADFDAQVRLARDPIYLTRLWISVVHPLIVLMGALGVLALRWKARPVAATSGFLFFLLWAATEGVQQSMSLVSLNWTWRRNYGAATDEAARQAIRIQVAGFDAVWDGLFFFVLLTFVVANILYFRATWGGDLLQRIVAVGFALAAALGVLSYATTFGGLSEAAMGLLYPTVQPLARLLTGVWLVRAGRAAAQSGSA